MNDGCLFINIYDFLFKMNIHKIIIELKKKTNGSFIWFTPVYVLIHPYMI